MADVGLAEKAGRDKVGRAGPHLDRIAPALEADDELVVRDLSPRTVKGGLLVVNRKTGRLHGGFIGPPWCIASVVIDDLDVDATVDGSLDLVKDGSVREFVGGNAKRVAGRRLLDVVETGFEQAAREPNDLRVRRVVEVLGRGITEFLGELLARDGAAVEPYAVACAVLPFLLGVNLELELVLGIAGKGARLAVHRQDAKAVSCARRRGVVAP